MDYIVAKSTYSYLKEQMTPEDPVDQEKYFRLDDLIAILISFYAAYLSWKANPDVKVIPRILYAFTAYLFGFIYLILYLIFRYPELRKTALKK